MMTLQSSAMRPTTVGGATDRAEGSASTTPQGKYSCHVFPGGITVRRMAASGGSTMVRAPIVGILACSAFVWTAAAAEPTLHLEGKATFAYLDACSVTSCPAVLNAVVDGAPYGPSQLRLPLSIGTTPNDFTGCRPVTGRGGRLDDGSYEVTFSGEMCDVPIKGLSAPPAGPTPVPVPTPVARRFPGHSITGAIQIHVRGVTCVAQPLAAAAGTLTVYGGPIGDPWLVSIVGAASSIPLCPLPSP